MDSADRDEDTGHATTRRAFRIWGPVLLAAGLALIVIAFAEMLTITHGPPKLFWLFFLGAPIAFVGGSLCRLGYMGLVGRYVAREVGPAVAEGFRAAKASPGVRCRKCSRENASDARFCSACGAPIAS